MGRQLGWFLTSSGWTSNIGRHFCWDFHSETDDVEGDVRGIADAPAPERKEIEKALLQFLGEIDQVPPTHSAVKIAGRRAYSLARARKEVHLTARPVMIHELSIRRFEYPSLELDIKCGSGTYVRALGRDLAAALNTTAVMSALTRTSIGAFQVDDALSLDDLDSEALTKHLQPALAAVPHLRRICLHERELGEIRHGRPVVMNRIERKLDVHESSEYAALNSAGELAAIVQEKRGGEFWPISNFQ